MSEPAIPAAEAPVSTASSSGFDGPGMVRAVGRIALRIAVPLLSILAFWYLMIFVSGMPEFVIPRPERVIETLIEDRNFITTHLLVTLSAASIGFLLANVLGIGLAVLFVALPVSRPLLMPTAITIRNIPFVALISVLVLAIGDSLGSKVLVVALAGFFPVLVNTYRGLLSVDPIYLDRMRILDARPWDVFLRVRLPFSLPYIVAAQEITGSQSIIVATVVEWMTSSAGLGYILNRALAQYRGDQVYAVALLAALVSYIVYAFVHYVGGRLNWQERPTK